MTPTIPCIAIVEVALLEHLPEYGLGLLWTKATIQFDARHATKTLAIGEQIRLTVRDELGQRRHLFLTIYGLVALETPHQFEVRASHIQPIVQVEEG